MKRLVLCLSVATVLAACSGQENCTLGTVACRYEDWGGNNDWQEMVMACGTMFGVTMWFPYPLVCRQDSDCKGVTAQMRCDMRHGSDGYCLCL